MLLISKENHGIVEVVGVIYMVVVVDIDPEVGYMVVIKLVRAVASIMEVKVNMAIVVGGMMEVDMVEEEVGITGASILVIFKEI